MRLHAEPVEMDAAAAAAADDLPLPALFDGASRLHGLASSSALDQDGIRTGVDLLRCCDRMVSKLGLFSPNEDVATANLKYLLVPYYLAEMTQKIAQEDRISVLKASQDHLKEFIALCQVLELIPEDELELSRQKQPDTMANRRAQKIAQFKRQQAAETKLQEIRERKERRGRSLRAAALSAPTEAGEEDDLEDDGEEEREAWLATISLALCKAFDLLDMLKKEEEMLLAVKERKAKEKAKGEKVGEEAVEYEDDFDDTPLPAVRRCADASHEEEEDESDRGGSVPFPSTASNDEAVNEVSASQVLEKEAAEGEVVEAKKGAEPRKALDGRITKALAALLLSPNREARMVVFQSYKRLKAHNDLNELLIDDIIKCFCQEIRTNKDLTSCFLDFLICIAKETSFYKECNSQGSRDFEGRLCALAGSVLDIVDYIRSRKDLKELISYEQIAHVLATWTPLCVSMSWEDLQKHPVLHKTLTKLLKYNWSTTMKGSSCSQSDVKEMELVKEISKQNCMISELRQSMVVMEKAIKQNNAAPVDDSALALRELERQVKALQIEKEEMKYRLQLMEDRNIKMKDRLQEAEVYRKEAEVYRKKLLNENLDAARRFCHLYRAARRFLPRDDFVTFSTGCRELQPIYVVFTRTTKMCMY